MKKLEKCRRRNDRFKNLSFSRQSFASEAMASSLVQKAEMAKKEQDLKVLQTLGDEGQLKAYLDNEAKLILAEQQRALAEATDPTSANDPTSGVACLPPG